MSRPRFTVPLKVKSSFIEASSTVNTANSSKKKCSSSSNKTSKIKNEHKKAGSKKKSVKEVNVSSEFHSVISNAVFSCFRASASVQYTCQQVYSQLRIGTNK